MHLKNFSLYEIDDKYQMTPAYDLVPVLMIFNQQEMALTINGKNKNLTKNDFYKFSQNIEIEKQFVDNIHNEILLSKTKMINFINKTDLSDEEKNKFISFITNKIDLLCQ